MRIGVISDTHIPERAKEIPGAILDEFKKVDLIIHGGDLVDLNVLKVLREICYNVVAVWGNMDPYEVRKKIPQKEIVKADSYKIGVTHGYGHPDKLIELMTKIFEQDNVDVIIFGHSHVPVNEKKGNILYFNPGSPTDKVFSPFNSYGIIEIKDTIEAKIIKI